MSVEPNDDYSWDRLQMLLFRLKPGDTVTINSVAARTGLGVESVDTVLQALTRVQLFEKRNQTTFVRARARIAALVDEDQPR